MGSNTQKKIKECQTAIGDLAKEFNKISQVILTVDNAIDGLAKHGLTVRDVMDQNGFETVAEVASVNKKAHDSYVAAWNTLVADSKTIKRLIINLGALLFTSQKPLNDISEIVKKKADKSALKAKSLGAAVIARDDLAKALNDFKNCLEEVSTMFQNKLTPWGLW